MSGLRLRKLKSVDFFKKLPSDLTEATLTGAWISIAASIVMGTLMVMELWAFLSTSSTTSLVVDRSSSSDLLKINFNISFPALSCEFATIDVSDTLGTKRMNITKTVHKTPIDAELLHLGPSVQDKGRKSHKYDEEGLFDDYPDIDVSQPIDHFNFKQTVNQYPIVIVNFYAPWCHWCQRLEPTWEAATQAVHERYPESDGRIRFAKAIHWISLRASETGGVLASETGGVLASETGGVLASETGGVLASETGGLLASETGGVDCVAEQALCQEHFIQAFPSIRVFRRGHDEVAQGGRLHHEAYEGDRTLESFLSFADKLVPSAGQPHHRHDDLVHAPITSGCNLKGFVMVKKVPGTLHFTARSDSHTFQHAWTNISHVVHYLTFGHIPNKHKLAVLKRLHPAGLDAAWADKLVGHKSVSETTQTTHEHYLQVVLTTVEGLGSAASNGYDAYEYTVHSHSFESDDIPSAKVTYDLSPLQILVQETRKPLYHLLTTTSAIVGGVFTVAGMVDAIFYQSFKMMKKNQLGKQG